MSSKIYLPPKHHFPILEDPINFYYIPVFRSFFLKRLELVLSFSEGQRLGNVLDIGCASGVLFPELSKRSDFLVGIDTFLQEYSLKGLMKFENIDAKILWGDATALSFKEETFDTVICISTFEHIEDSVGVMEEISRVIKPGGKLLAGFPVRNTITNTLLGESTGFHVASHNTILDGARQVFNNVSEKHFPSFLPLDISLYCAFEGVKS